MTTVFFCGQLAGALFLARFEAVRSNPRGLFCLHTTCGGDVFIPPPGPALDHKRDHHVDSA